MDVESDSANSWLRVMTRLSSVSETTPRVNGLPRLPIGFGVGIGEGSVVGVRVGVLVGCGVTEPHAERTTNSISDKKLEENNLIRFDIGVVKVFQSNLGGYILSLSRFERY